MADEHRSKPDQTAARPQSDPAAVGLHVNQIRRYETGQAQPSIEGLKKIALNLHISTDQLLFDDSERGPTDDELKLKFEAVQRLAPKERNAVRTMIDGVLLMEDTKRYTARAS